MGNIRHLIIVLCLLIVGCADQEAKTPIRTAQDEQLPPPVINAINWPAPYSELQDGALVILGDVASQVGLFEDMPMGVISFAVPLIEPPLPEATQPPTQEELQQTLIAHPLLGQWIDHAREMIFKRVTEGPFLTTEEERLKGMDNYPLFSSDFDGYEFVNFDTGEFRIDFQDYWARLKSGYPLILMVYAVDQAGQIAYKLNLFKITDSFPEFDDELDSHSIALADRITGLGNALLEVLAVSGDDRSLEITMIEPYLGLFEDLYGDGYSIYEWDVDAENFRNAAIAAAQNIADQDIRDQYEIQAGFMADNYEFDSWRYWSSHFVLLKGQDLLDGYSEGHQYTIDRFTKYNEMYYLEDRGSGVKALTVIIYEGADVFAQLEIIGDPDADLYVCGFIGEHTITPDDYNPSLINLIMVFIAEGYKPPVGI